MKAVVLISGHGSNLQAIIDKRAQICLEICCVISDKSDAYGLVRAQQENITTAVISGHKNKKDFDIQLIKIIDTYEIELIVLAGFMRILTPLFTQKYSGRILNIHPSLLPKFKGLNTHRRVLLAAEKIHGASVHFVNDILDDGALIAQSIVAVNSNDTPETLAKRVLKKEHILYPKVIAWFVKKRLYLKNNCAYLDEKAITAPIII